MATNVPQPTFGANGFIAPTQQQILTGVQADLNNAFGGNLNPALDTPQGQLATSEASIIGDVYDLFTFYTTQTDPAFAAGRMQDAIGRIYFIERLPALPTVVECVCSGLTGVTIPVGALAQAEDGNIYSCTGSGQIGLSGSITLSFSCNVNGPIACPANSLNKIYQAIPGWDSVDNPTDGVQGQDVESRYQFEARRQASVALNSVGSIPAVQAAVLDVPGVLDAYTIDNSGSGTITVGGTSLAPHSLYVAAVGPSAQDIGNAIWSKKAPGCAYNGNTTVTVTDSNSGYSPPLPTYQVTFETPSALPILFQVNIVNSTMVPANAVQLIQNAIIAAFGGADGGPRARIGSTLLATRYVAPITALGSWAQVALIELGSANSPAATFTGSIGGTGGPSTTLTVTSISGVMAIGQEISGSGVVPGTFLTGFISGVGGNGTYSVNISQTAPPEPMTAAVASNPSVIVNINQVPTIAPSNISVSFV